jgi:hypothetical protein
MAFNFSMVFLKIREQKYQVYRAFGIFRDFP